MAQDKPKILIVDDKQENLFTLERLLQRLDVDTVQATCGFDALGLALEHELCLAIIDIQMPEMDGYELVELLRGNIATAKLPVIFVSAIHSDEYHHRKAYNAGAVDFLSKPFVPEILLSKAKIFIELYEQRRALEEEIQQRKQAETALRDANTVLIKRAVQLETNNQVGNHVTSILDLSELLDTVVGLIQTMFGYYCVGVWLLDESATRVTLYAVAGRDSARNFKPGFAVDVETKPSIIARVCRTQRHYLANDLTNDPNYLYTEGLPEAQAELTLPLLFGQEQRLQKGMVGVLDIQSDKVMAFDTEDITGLHMLANQVAIAIRNARLYAEVTRLNEGLEANVQKRTSELREAYEQLEMLDRNKSDFIQVVSHELRTPLTLIKGYGQMLSKDPTIATDDTRALQISGIITGANRMQEMINSMLDVIRIDSDTLNLCVEQLLLNDIIEKLAKKFAPSLAERSLNLTLEALEALPELEGDPEALSKLFEHLLVNAIKYTPDGGSITIHGRVLDMTINRQQVQFVEVVVSDTGIGIAPELQEVIFTKFYQAGQVAHHSSGTTQFKAGGPGLGLAIARGIAKAHQGQVWAESPGYDEEACPGSKFHVILPMEQNPPEN